MSEKTTNTITKQRTKKPYTTSPLVAEMGRIPPQAVDMEEAVLGAMMLEKESVASVIDVLNPECFYNDAHALIYEAINFLFQSSKPIDLLTVTQHLKKSGKLELAGGAFYITKLTSRIASSANIEFHARIVLQKYIQRELIRMSNETIKDAYEDNKDVLELLDEAETKLFDISEGNIRRGYANMNDLIKRAVEEIEAASKHEGGLKGIPSGFMDLDRLTNGWQKTDLIIIAARPGMGKTAFVLSLARNAAVTHKRPVAFFSLEMSGIQLVNRLITSETEIASDKIQKGNLEDYEWEQLNSKIKPILEAPIYIDDTPALSIFELRAKCRRLVSEKKVELIVIDYMQLMVAGTDNKSGNREQEISSISRSLKAIAKELDVPIITLSQLSRAVETRGGASKRPQLSDLRESGAIEQDADMVMFIYRPDYYGFNEQEDPSESGKTELIIAKNRKGPVDDVHIKFISHLTKFTELDIDFADESSSPMARNLETGRKTIESRMNKPNDGNQNSDVPF
jgi:replicative DNA helicase